jgi:DNA-binding transcriptional ArsR family regulator
VGDPARANILAALIDGRALTATELAAIAGVAPQTASGHLAKLTRANLLALNKQGRHRYYRVASPLVGSMLESIMAVAAVQLPPRAARPSRLDEAMRTARSCYDHIAWTSPFPMRSLSAATLFLPTTAARSPRQGRLSSEPSARRRRMGGASFADPASIGASGVGTSPGRSVPRCANAASICIGSSAVKIPAL